MATHIVQGMNSAILTTNHEERVGIHLQGNIIARLGNLAGMSGKKPTGSPDLVDVSTIDGFVGMKFSRQGPTRATFLHQ